MAICAAIYRSLCWGLLQKASKKPEHVARCSQGTISGEHDRHVKAYSTASSLFDQAFRSVCPLASVRLLAS